MEQDEVDSKRLGLPKKLYYVKIVGVLDGTVIELRYAQKGGGKYTNKAHAKAQRDNLRRYNKLDARLFETQELEWTEAE